MNFTKVLNVVNCDSVRTRALFNVSRHHSMHLKFHFFAHSALLVSVAGFGVKTPFGVGIKATWSLGKGALFKILYT